MQKELSQESDGCDPQLHREEPAKEAPPPDVKPAERKGVRWSVWLLVILVALLLASSIVNLIVSQRAYEGSKKQVKAIEQLTQSIKSVQRSIADLSSMIEQSPPEDEPPEDEGESSSAGDGSI